MDNYIIKGCGTIDEIIVALKTMQKVFKPDTKLTEMATASRYGRLETAVRKQLNDKN